MSFPEQRIAEAIVNAIRDNVPQIKTVSFDKIRLSSSEFDDWELPACQLWDVSQAISHEQGRIKVTWSLALEIILKTSENSIISQVDMWELRRNVQRALWLKPNLGLSEVIHLVYVGNVSDLHLEDNFYITRIDFEVLYYDKLTGTCP